MPTTRTDGQLRAALTRTVSADQFTAEAAARLAAEPTLATAARAFAARTTAVAPAPAADQRAGATTDASFWSDGRDEAQAPDPAFAAEGLADRLARAGHAPLGERRRYQLDGVLGVGATGRVYALIDRDLERPVAVKVLLPDGGGGGGERIASFVDEARITASLAHPNVLPVHELGVDETGQVFFTMKRVEGRSLADAIEDSTATRRAPPLDDPNALVSVFIGVCQALAYAHHRRVVHQDVKPANIMLGEFGEVLLVDWGSAVRRDGATPRIYGTPLYMSPEQARRESVDERSDVYCVGASLFHALTLRVPTWDDDAARFFALKRDGAIAEPDAAERAAVPAALLDIARAAMRPRPEDRYAGCDALLADLRAYQAGLAVRAHRDSLRERLARWHRRHARAIWSTTAVIAVVAALVAMLAGERLKQIAVWGAPVVSETFDDDGWRTRWTPLTGVFTAIDGQLVSQNPMDSSIVLDRQLWGPVAVDYDAESPAGEPASDLSLFWCADVKRAPDGRIVDLVEPYHLQFGAQGGAFTTISNARGRLACSEMHPEPGRRYHVHAEIADDRMSLSIDGRLACEWTEAIRFDGGYVGLYAYRVGKRYDDLRVSLRGEAERVPATSIGDAFLRARQYDLAVQLYARVTATHAGTAIGEEALYKQGLCWWLRRRYEQAEQVWRPLAGGAREPQLRLHRLERLCAADDHGHALAEMAALWGLADPAIRRGVTARWGQAVTELVARGQSDVLPRYLALEDALFPDDSVVDWPAARALLAVGRAEEVLSRHPSQHDACCRALIELGRQPEIVDRYPDQLWDHAQALIATGRGDEVPPYLWNERAEGLVERDLPMQALMQFPNGFVVRVRALCQLGRLAEGLAAAGAMSREYVRASILAGREEVVLDANDRETCAEALLARGDARAAWTVAPDDRLVRPIAAMTLGLRAWAAGRRDEAAAWFARARDARPVDERLRFVAELAVPFQAGADDGDWTAYDAACARIVDGPRWPQQQRPWHDAAYLAGRIDDAAFLAQPHRAYASAKLLVRRAMRAERRGDPAAALDDYRAYLALPRWRRWWTIDAAVDEFVAGRTARLGRSG